MAAQMVAANLKKVSKDDMQAMALSGKREEMATWLYVFEKTIANAFGVVVNRLIKPTREKGAITFQQSEWDTFTAVQREYVRQVDRQLHLIVLKLIKRGTTPGETLMANIIANDKTIGNSGTTLIQFVCHEATHQSKAECDIIKAEMAEIKMSLSDDGETLRQKATSLRTKWESMPEQHRGVDSGLVDALLAAMPTACDEQRESLKTTINMRTALHEMYIHI